MSRLPAALAYLSRQKDVPIEVIIIQSKGEARVEAHGLPASRVIVEPLPICSPSFLRNSGVRASQGRWLLFLDADILLADPHTCARFLSFLEHSPERTLSNPIRKRIVEEGQERLIEAVVAGRFVEDEISPLGDFIFKSIHAQELADDLVFRKRTGRIEYARLQDLRNAAGVQLMEESAFRANLWGGCIAVSRSMFDLVGGYSELFHGWGHEDADLKQKLAHVTKLISIHENPALSDIFVYHLDHPMTYCTENSLSANLHLRTSRRIQDPSDLVRIDIASATSLYGQDLRRGIRNDLSSK